MMKTRILYLVQGAVIAALYVALVYVTNIFSPYLNYGLIQFRLSELLCVLPIFTPAAIPGLFLGCLLSNIVSPMGIWDLIFGSLASLAAAYLTYRLRQHKILALLPPVAVNALVIGPMLFIMGILPWEGAAGTIALLLNILFVGVGQAVVCIGVGFPFMKAIERSKVFHEPVR